MKPDMRDRKGASAGRRPAPSPRPGRAAAAPAAAGEDASWTFLTNHSHVLVCLVADPEATVEEIARRVGITERSARRIIGDLEAAEYLSRERVGRRNRYRFDARKRLRHPVERHRTVGALLELVAGGAE
jgi:DNA-binding transcriptional ArsR family regulator